MDKGKEYRFRIDAFTPQSIPMARLAEYMADLAVLLGQKEKVHFVGVVKGSVVLIQDVEREAAPKVQARLAEVHKNIAPHDAMKAYREINKRLANDNAVGHLYSGEAEIIHFPGCEMKQPLSFGAFTEHGSFDGVLIKIGGKDETVPTHLLDGKLVHICNSTRELARELAQHLFRETLRVYGEGRWERDAEGEWFLKRFNIASYEVLDDAPLSTVVSDLQKVKGSGWKEMDDPIGELRRLRDGPDEVH